MKIEISRLPEKTLEEFADEHGLVMEIGEREFKDLPRFWANFKGVEVTDGYTLCGAFGDGETPEEAIKNYGKRISLKTLKIGKDYIKAPKLT